MLSANQCKNLWNMARIISVMLASRYKLSYKPISIDRKLICQLLSAIGDLNPKLLPSSKLDGKHPGCLSWGCGPKSKRKWGIVLMSYVLYFVDTLRVRQTTFYRQHLFWGVFSKLNYLNTGSNTHFSVNFIHMTTIFYILSDIWNFLLTKLWYLHLNCLNLK